MQAAKAGWTTCGCEQCGKLLRLSAAYRPLRGVPVFEAAAGLVYCSAACCRQQRLVRAQRKAVLGHPVSEREESSGGWDEATSRASLNNEPAVRAAQAGHAQQKAARGQQKRRAEAAFTQPTGSDDETEGDSGSGSEIEDLSFFDTEEAHGFDGDWLEMVGAEGVQEPDEYEDQLRRQPRQEPFLHGMADLPSPAEWDRLSTAPEPDEYENPDGFKTSPPFVAGAIHGADPSCGADSAQECAERWREMVPDMPEMVLRWIGNEDGVQISPPDMSPVDEPARPKKGPAQRQLDDGIRKLLRTRAVRLWNKNTEGDPVFITPVDAVPKKVADEFRIIHDWRVPNKERGIPDRRCRFEGLRHLPAVATKGGWAASIDMKSGYHAVRCGPPELMCFRARIDPAWVDADELKAAGYAQSGDKSGFVDVILTWVALSMGNKQSAWIYTKVMRCVARRWRACGTSTTASSSQRRLRSSTRFYSAGDSRASSTPASSTTASTWDCRSASRRAC